MKRNTSLLRLSREHHTALVLAKRAQRMAKGKSSAVQDFMVGLVETFRRELEPHFRIEEQALLPALDQAGETALVARTLSEHEKLRSLVALIEAGDPASLGSFAEALAAHVRFEERELFPVAESVLTDESLAMIERHSQSAEQPVRTCSTTRGKHVLSSLL